MSDASYVIDIAANMPAGEATSAQLDTLVQNLTGAGKGADHFQVAMKQLAGSLDVAKAASAAANASLAEGNAMYKQLEKAANLAAKAAEKAALKGELSPELSRTAHQADEALKGYAHTLKSLEQNAASASKAEAEFARQLGNVQKLSSHTDKTFQQNAEKLGKVTGALNNFGGPVGSIAGKVTNGAKAFEELSGAIGASNAAMLVGAAATVGVVVAVLAVTAAVIAGTIAIAAWAVGLADAKRSADLHGQAVAAMTPELDGLRSTFADVTKATGLQNDELEALAAKLAAAKTPADRMAGALADAALQEAALGKGGADKFIAKIQESKGAVTGLANSTRLALGGVVAQQLRGIDAQSAAFKRNFGSLFSGLNIEPVLAGLERLGALFDQNTAAGQTIKFLFESVFQPLINQADKAAIVLEAFALGFLIGMTRLYIALKPVAKAIAEFFGFNDPTTANTLDMVKTAGEFVASAFVAFIGILGALGVALAAVVGFLLLPQIALAALIAAVVYAGVAIYEGFVGAWSAVVEFLSGISLTQIGSDILNGLIDGIINMGPNMLKAITGVVDGAIGAAKKLLGIASPSKVFAEIGMNTGEGFAGGVEDTAPDAQAAMTDMVDPGPAVAKASAGAPAAGASSSSAPTVHIENLYLAGEKASEAETQSLSEALTRLIRGDAAALGGEAAPA